jgi:hypothetical protein
MKKGIIIAIVAIVIVGSGALFYFQLNKNNNNNDTTNDGTTNDGTTNGGTNNGGTTNGGTTNGGTTNGGTTNGGTTNGGTTNGGTTNGGTTNGGTTNGGTTNGGTTTDTTVKTGASCQSGDYIKLDSSTLTYCISSDGSLNVKTTSEQVSSESNSLNANAALLTSAGAKITFNEKIKNIALFYVGQGEAVGFLGLSIMTTESGKAYLIYNDSLYANAQIEIRAEVDVTEKVVSFTSPDKTVKCTGSTACSPSTTVKTASGKVYVVADNGGTTLK